MILRIRQPKIEYLEIYHAAKGLVVLMEVHKTFPFLAKAEPDKVKIKVQGRETPMRNYRQAIPTIKLK